ncbi:MAG: hypothetical protein EOO62_06515 [Hymenobacter sp.]|nr:MAG: hypothetical protein EOO62_06515 [Hymenobacter sp.]
MLRADPPVLAWREYAITGDWNAAGTDSTVYVAGLTTRRWASLGWVLDAKGNPQTVQLDVQAKTWVAFEALLATKQPALTKRAQYPKYTSDYKSFTAENFGHIVVVDTTQGQPFSKNLPAITLADVPQILQVRNLGGSGNGDALTLVSVSSDESFVLLPGERAVFVAVEISRGYPYNDVVAGWDILAAERPQLAGRGLVKTGNTFHARVKVSTDTILTFMESGTYAVISSGTFTVDTTAAEPGVVVFAELAPAATQPTLPPQFELVGNDYQTGKRQGFAAQVMPSGQIEYFFYLKP